MRKFLLIILVVVAMVFTLMPTSRVYAGLFDGQVDQACEGVTGVQGGCSGQKVSNDEKLNKVVSAIINIFSIFVGVAAVIMIIIGGFKYILSSGDSNSTTSAKNTILYAIIGLVIVFFAQVIVKFVLGRIK